MANVWGLVQLTEIIRLSKSDRIIWIWIRISNLIETLEVNFADWQKKFWMNFKLSTQITKKETTGKFKDAN